MFDITGIHRHLFPTSRPLFPTSRPLFPTSRPLFPTESPTSPRRVPDRAPDESPTSPRRLDVQPATPGDVSKPGLAYHPKQLLGYATILQRRSTGHLMSTLIPHFIDGQRAGGQSQRTADVFNPNTGEVQARVPMGSSADVEAAVAVATGAQKEWAAWNPQRRARVL